MKRFAFILIALSLAVPASARTHTTTYKLDCSKVWPSVTTVLKTSGKYKVVSIDNTERMASFQVGAFWTGTTLNTVTLNPVEQGCSMAVNTTFRGITHDDAGDLTKRVDESLGISHKHVPNYATKDY